MQVIEEKDLLEIGVNWDATIQVIEEAVRCIMNEDFAQPIKPYLRYGDLKNRIIAMPAFVGGEINMAGIKWISSFPSNIHKGIPRAHSVVILNDAETGVPVALINSALLSVIRTASVSGLVIKRFIGGRSMDKLKVGITGFGPIGQYHAMMCQKILGDRLDTILIYDLRDVRASSFASNIKIKYVDQWEDAYLDADIFITCTVSDKPYINKEPKSGSLHLNISLRDYETSTLQWFKDAIIVDDWEEVCRERTDIEMMHLENGLEEKDTKSIVDVVFNNCLDGYSLDQSIMFNPMGMAVFDIAIANLYKNIYEAV